MKSKRIVSAVAALAVASSTFAGLTLTANAEIIQTDVFAKQTFDEYTAGANTEVVGDPTNADNKVLKISNGASVTFADVFNADHVYLTMDINYGTGITGTATKDTDGLYFAFAESGSKLGTAMKVFGGSTADTAVPVGYSYGGGNGQYGKAGSANVGTWYTVLVEVNKTASTVGYTYYDRAEFADKGTNAAVVLSKTGMGYRNGQVPKQLIISMTTADGEYFYLDNVRSYTQEDTEAKNELQKISFKTTPGSVIIPPAGDKEKQSFPVELELMGTKGDLTAEECDSIVWTHKGTEKDDGYIGWDFDNNKASGSIGITNGVSTYFSVLTATVKKGDVTQSIDYRFMINASGTSDPNQIYPAAGYPIDMNEYPDSLVGYQVVNGAIADEDPILAHWASVGSNGARSLSLQQDAETGDKYLQISNVGGPGTAGNSTVAGLTVGTPSSQIIFEFDAKMVNGSEFVFANTTQNNTYTAGYKLSFNGSSIISGDGNIPGISAGTWYKFVISYDITIQEYYIKVYNEDGTELIGEITNQKGAENASPSVFSIGGAFPTAIKNMKVYKPTVASMSINSAAATIKVPEAGENPQTLDLSAEMLTADGLAATGNVVWEFENGEVSNAIIESTGAQTARITVSEGAPSGDVVVIASKDGIRATKTIKLTSSSNNVAFTKSVSNITIPFDGEDAVVAEYAAETRTGNGDPIEGEDTITYKLLDSTGTKDANVKGVTFDNGKLTVASGAAPAVVYVYAENAEGLSNTVRVNIHGMTFGFGSGEMEEGYTPVTANTVYNDNTGYGFASSTGLTDEVGDVKGESIYTVKVKVPNGNYKINVETTSANMTSEAVSGSATGTIKQGSEFNVAVCDGILDLAFEADTTISSLQISQIAAKSASDKPAVYSIGDSTTKNSGHYTKYAEDKAAQAADPTKWVDEREYGSWGNCVTAEMYSDTFSSYNNHGMAGRNSASYYNQARLEAVLLAIAPGDYVTINMGINSQANEPYEQLMENYYIQGVLQRGGIPVILTHTPQGPVGNYENSNYVNGQFNCSRAGDGRINFLKSMAEKYNLNLIDIGTWGNDYYNSLTTADLDKANTANSINVGYTAPTTVLELVQSWCPDHNHYTAEIGTVFAEYIMGELKKIENGQVDPTPTATATATTDPTPTATATTEPTPTATATATTDPTPTATATTEPGMITVYEADAVVVVAAYDANGVLTKIESITQVKENQEVLEFPEIAGQKVFVWDSLANMKPVGTKQIPAATDPAATTDPGEEATADPGEEATADPGEQATPDPEKEAKMIWKAEQNTEYTAGQTLADGLELVFGTAEGATPVYADFVVSDTDTTPITKLIGGVLFTGYVSATKANGSWSGTSIDPAKTTAIKYTASKTGVLTVYFDNVGTDKKICVGQEGDKKGDIEAAATLGTGEAMAFEYGVTAGQSYYIYIAGSKGRFCGVAFDENGVVEPPVTQPPTEPEIPAPKENEWTMSADYLNGCVAGTELMVGLTTLFDNTSTNKVYLSGGANGKFADGIATGTALKYVASKNGKLAVSFVDLGTPSSDGSPKTMYIVEEGGKQSTPVAAVANDSATDKMNGTIDANVEAGKIYYIYAAGTKARFSGATFTAE